MELQRYRAYGAGTSKTVAGRITMNLKWATEYGAELLGQKPFAAVKRKHRRHAIPRKVEHFQLPFRQWDGRIKRSMKEDLRKGRGQVYPLDGCKPIRSCNEIEVAKILRHFREHAFWVSASHPLSQKSGDLGCYQYPNCPIG
jgi:hypothetical protein